MGFWNDIVTAQKDHDALHKFDATLGATVLRGDVLKHEWKKYPVAGMVAEFEHGADIGARITATRVVLTGVFALGLKKNRNKVYVKIETRDGDQILLEEKAKNERAAREFAAKVNRAGEYFAAREADSED